MQGVLKVKPAAPAASDDERAVTINTKIWNDMPIDQKIVFLPLELQPESPVKGAHAFMVFSRNNKASFQILFKGRAYFLKTDKNGNRFVGEGRTVSWKKHGGPKACWDMLRDALEW